MDTLNFISTFTGQIISRPVAVLMVVLILRKPIAELLPKLRSWDGPAGKFDFGKGLDAAERSASQAASSIENKVQEIPAAQYEEAVGLAREAGDNPSFAILNSWERLTAALLDLAAAKIPRPDGDRFPPPMRTGADAAGSLRQAHIIDDNFYEAVTQLRHLRNRVAHGQHNPSAGEAITYVEAAEELRRSAYALAAMASHTSDIPSSDAAANGLPRP